MTGYSYSAQGLVARMTLPMGQVWQYSYDAAGRLTPLTDPDGQGVRPSGRLPEGLAAEVDRLVGALDRLGSAKITAAPLDERTREGLRALGYAE